MFAPLFWFYSSSSVSNSTLTQAVCRLPLPRGGGRGGVLESKLDSEERPVPCQWCQQWSPSREEVRRGPRLPPARGRRKSLFKEKAQRCRVPGASGMDQYLLASTRYYRAVDCAAVTKELEVPTGSAAAAHSIGALEPGPSQHPPPPGGSASCALSGSPQGCFKRVA